MEAIKAVDLVKISKLIPIYKNEEPANAIEVARVKRSDGEELQYDIIVQKDLYELDEEVLYIQPDYCLPQTVIFNEYHYPDEGRGKSRLGKKGRIRAIKYKLSFEGKSNPI